MLAVTDLNVRYGMHEALASVSLQVSRDEIVVILGANGAGKSTLLSAIAGNCIGDTDGRIVLDGENLLGLDAAQIVEQGIAFVPEGRGVFADLSVEENLQLGSYAEHARLNEQDNLREVLSLFPKLAERKKQIVRTMSGGEQQMVAIGRALMSAPSILMLDEPSLGLSPLLCKELFSSLQQVRDSGVGILLVEQNAKQSLSISDRGYLLGNGKILGQDTAKNLLNNPTVQAAYLGGAIATQHATPVTGAIASATPVASVVTETADTGNTPEAVPAELNITPNIARYSAETLSSDSLLNEDIDALVARAGTSAAEFRHADTALPIQVVKLSSNRTSTGNSASNRTAATSASANGNSRKSLDVRDVSDVLDVRESRESLDLPVTQDSTVQALLDEFELAAKNAASGTSNSISGKSSSGIKASAGDGHSRNSHDEPLPHIPVYKKSSVTVYRRDGSGTLRKQD